MVASSESAIRLNSAASRPNSSRPPPGTRAARSPSAIRRAARPDAATGRRMPRAMKPRREQREEDRQQPRAEEADPELAERLLDRPRREHEVERWRARLAAADDEDRLPAGGTARRSRARPPATISRSAGETSSSAPSSRAGVHGFPSPKSAITSASPRRRNCSASPLAANAARVDRCRLGRREQHRQVEVGLLAGVGDELVPERGLDEGVDADPDRPRPSPRPAGRA